MRIVFRQFYNLDGSIPVDKPEYATAWREGPVPEKDDYFELSRLESIPTGEVIRGYITNRRWEIEGDQRTLVVSFRPVPSR